MGVLTLSPKFLIILKKEKKMINLDAWQKEVIAYKGNMCVCSGRQTGKSQAIAIKAAEFMVNNPKKQVLIISVTEDQAIELLNKIVIYVDDNYKRYMKKGKDRPTKSTLKLTNGSMVRTKAVGASGMGVRGLTIDLLIADEAAFMPEEVWPAVTPMLLTTGGSILLISTPHGKKGYFYQCYHDEHFKTIHVNSLDVIDNREISSSWIQFQKDKALEFLASEKSRMSIRAFGQEYEGQFIDDLMQFYNDDDIRKSLIQQKITMIPSISCDYVLGVDIGRLGGDATVYIILERRGELFIQRDKIVWKETELDKIPKFIIEIDKTWKFQKIYLDSGGIGIGVFDTLYNTPGFKKRTVAIDNSQRIVEYTNLGKEKKKKIMKEEIYANLLFLMNKGKILLFDDGDTWLSLKSVQYEYLNQRGGASIKIFSTDHSLSHIIEALTRAAYYSKEKINKAWISYI